jgi:hypothetical protein
MEQMNRQIIWWFIGFLVVLGLISMDFPAMAFNPRIDPQLYRFEVHGPRGASCSLDNFYIDIDVYNRLANISFTIECNGEIPDVIRIYVPASLILTEYSWAAKDGNVLKDPADFRLDRRDRANHRESNLYIFYDFSTKVEGDANFVFSGKIIPNGRFLVNLIDFKNVYSQGREIGEYAWFNDRVCVRLGRNYKLIDARTIRNAEVFTLTFKDGERVYAIDRSNLSNSFAISSYDAARLRYQTVLTWLLFTALGAILLKLLPASWRKIKELKKLNKS